MFAGIGRAALLFTAAAAVRRGWTRLRVDEDGVAMSFPVSGIRNTHGGAAQLRAGWSAVHRVVLGPSEGFVQVVLRNDAPMPAWLTSRIIDPGDPEGGVRHAREVPGPDAAVLSAAVRALAPHVEVRSVMQKRATRSVTGCMV